MQEFGLNISDLQRRVLNNSGRVLDGVLDELLQKDYLRNTSRIYIGSYYCSHYFLQTPRNGYAELLNYARSRNLNVTLVVPPLFENDLDAASELILYLKNLSEQADNTIDEISINDLGMLEMLKAEKSAKIVMGRVLQKDNRDPRYPDFFEQTHTHRVFGSYYSGFMKDNNISGLELDFTHREIAIPNISEPLKVAVHIPYCYMSMGSICEFASMNKADDMKFRFADSCQCECDRAFIECNYLNELRFLRIGRSVQFKNDKCKICTDVPYRLIYTPIKELVIDAAEGIKNI